MNVVEVEWRCDECGATGKITHAASCNTFDVAGMVIANHNVMIAGCCRREDAMVSVGLNTMTILREPASSWIV